MTQNLLEKPTISQPLFSLNMPEVDDLFPGFAPGDFAVLYGSSVMSLTSLLCIRAQLPPQLGGLGSNVVFVDGGNSFRLYKIARLAQLHELNPTRALERIFISRAFTAHQLTALIMEKLEETTKQYKAKLVVISDIAGFFLDNDLPREEAEVIYSQLLSYLSDFAKKHRVIVVASYLPYGNTKRNMVLKVMTQAKTETVMRFTKTSCGRVVALEKHPRFVLGTVELPFETVPLTSFMPPVGDSLSFSIKS